MPPGSLWKFIESRCRVVVLAATALLILTAGCTTVSGPSAPTTTESPTKEDFTSSGVSCSDDLWIEFWRLNEEQFWEQDVVRVTYTVPSNTSILFVTYVDGAVSGVDSPASPGEHADGAIFELDSAYSGKHTVQVVVFQDTNDNGQYDTDADSPCLNDDEVVQAGPRVIDFNGYA